MHIWTQSLKCSRWHITLCWKSWGSAETPPVVPLFVRYGCVLHPHCNSVFISSQVAFDPLVGFLHFFPPTLIASIASELAFPLITQSYLIKKRPTVVSGPHSSNKLAFESCSLKYRLIISAVIVSPATRVWADPALQGPAFNEHATCWWSPIATVIHLDSLAPY